MSSNTFQNYFKIKQELQSSQKRRMNQSSGPRTAHPPLKLNRNKNICMSLLLSEHFPGKPGSRNICGVTSD